jgi:hypothetical protein
MVYRHCNTETTVEETIIIIGHNLFYSEGSVFLFQKSTMGKGLKKTKYYYKMASEYFASFMSSEKDN